MTLYRVTLTTPLYTEINAESEQDAIEMLKDSIKSDSYSNSEFDVEEIEVCTCGEPAEGNKYCKHCGSSLW